MEEDGLDPSEVVVSCYSNLKPAGRGRERDKRRRRKGR